MFRLTISTMVFATLAAAGCGSDPGQTLSGRVNAGSFPEPVTHVRAVGTTGVVEAAVRADGSFTITLPAGDRYRVELVSAVRSSDLVLPRRTGALERTFYIASSSAAFELGAVRYVKDPDQQSYPDTGTGGGQDTGTGGGQDTGTGGGQDTGDTCGAEVAAPEDDADNGDGAVAEHTPDGAIGCDGEGGEEGDGGGGDEGGGGQDSGGGGQDSGGGGGE